MLNADIQSLLLDWRSDIDSCTVIFLQTPVRGRSLFFSTEAIAKGVCYVFVPWLTGVAQDPRVRHVPFPTHRPTLKEATRVYSMLAAVYTHDGLLIPSHDLLIPVRKTELFAGLPHPQEASRGTVVLLEFLS